VDVGVSTLEDVCGFLDVEDWRPVFAPVVEFVVLAVGTSLDADVEDRAEGLLELRVRPGTEGMAYSESCECPAVAPVPVLVETSAGLVWLCECWILLLSENLVI
jgi:hypothetical protein